MTIHSLPIVFSILLAGNSAPLRAQVAYDGGEPWNQRAESGPDSKVPGWFYNLGSSSRTALEKTATVGTLTHPAGGADDWADMGRTGAAGIANFLSPYSDGDYRKQALLHSNVIGEHPQSFPDTHGSPVMGMAYAALAANIEPANFRKLMDANRWWFTMAQCTDGTFSYQPNRDNVGYGSDARMSASSVVAFIFTIPKHSLVITGRGVQPIK